MIRMTPACATFCTKNELAAGVTNFIPVHLLSSQFLYIMRRFFALAVL